MELSEEEKKAIKSLKNEIEIIKIKIPRNYPPTYTFFKLIENTTAVQCLINLVDKLTVKVKQLEKGNLSLMESRIKWKNRYYKEKAKNKEYINKIREKIKRCNDYLKEEPMNIEKIEINAKISILQELLEEK